MLRWSDSLFGLRPAAREDASSATGGAMPRASAVITATVAKVTGRYGAPPGDAAYWQGPITLQARGGAAQGAPAG